MIQTHKLFVISKQTGRNFLDILNVILGKCFVCLFVFVLFEITVLMIQQIFNICRIVKTESCQTKIRITFATKCGCYHICAFQYAYALLTSI